MCALDLYLKRPYQPRFWCTQFFFSSSLCQIEWHAVKGTLWGFSYVENPFYTPFHIQEIAFLYTSSELVSVFFFSRSVCCLFGAKAPAVHHSSLVQESQSTTPELERLKSSQMNLSVGLGRNGHPGSVWWFCNESRALIASHSRFTPAKLGK